MTAEVTTRPAFVTITRTAGVDAGHEEVSLWLIWWSGSTMATHPLLATG